MANTLIYAPCDGHIVPIESIPESVLVGFGFDVGSFTAIALVPSDSVLGSPISGTLIDFSSPYSSFRLLSDEGVTVLVSFSFHVPEGLHDIFTPMVLEDSHVNVDTPIVRMDMDGLVRVGVEPMVFILALGHHHRVLPLLGETAFVVGGMTPILSASA